MKSISAQNRCEDKDVGNGVSQYKDPEYKTTPEFPKGSAHIKTLTLVKT